MRSTLAMRMLEISSTEEAVEMLIEADFETFPQERRRFAILNIPGASNSKQPARLRDVSQSPIADAVYFLLVIVFGWPLGPIREL